MTWEEFKQVMENNGVQDTDVFESIDVLYLRHISGEYCLIVTRKEMCGIWYLSVASW